METIPIADCEKIGFFRKTHGVHGEVVLEFEEHFVFSVEESERFFVELEGLLVPFFISEEGLRFRSSKAAIVKFHWVDTEKYAKRLIGNSAYLLQEEIIDEPEEDEELLIGFMVNDPKRGEIGIVEELNDYAGNVVLTVSYKNSELLIPYNEELLVELNEAERTVTLNLPEGLLEE